MPFLCWFRHKWVYDAGSRYRPIHRYCARCYLGQNWVTSYQNSGWEGSTYEPAHWRND